MTDKDNILTYENRYVPEKSSSDYLLPRSYTIYETLVITNSVLSLVITGIEEYNRRVDREDMNSLLSVYEYTDHRKIYDIVSFVKLLFDDIDDEIRFIDFGMDNKVFNSVIKQSVCDYYPILSNYLL